jgi:hypothetical protein
MRVVFCRPSDPQEQEDGFDLEADALEELEVESFWLPLELVVDDELEGALAELPDDGGLTVLRSWMLTEEEYERLVNGLADRGWHLVNDSAAYAAAHYLPNYYPSIESQTARTRWIFGTDLDEAWEAARELGPPPYLLKDHVKSAKHDPALLWIPPDADRATFDRICRAFIEHRGDRFERGLVFREVLPLAPVASDGEQPVYDEYRLFFWDGELIAAIPYYETSAEQVDVAQFERLGSAIDSRFFTADVARLITGSWTVIEIGDGGVSTLPPLMSPREFYRAISHATKGE